MSEWLTTHWIPRLALVLLVLDGGTVLIFLATGAAWWGLVLVEAIALVMGVSVGGFVFGGKRRSS